VFLTFFTVSLRSRLIISYSILLALIFLAFGSGLYVIVAYTLFTQVDRALQQTADEILIAGRFQNLEGLQLISLPALPFSTTAAYAQIWSMDGNLIAASPNLQGYLSPLDPNGLRKPVASISEVQIQQMHLRVLSEPVRLQDQPAGLLQVGTSLNLADRMLDSLLFMVFVGGALGIAISVLIGNWITRTALQPLETITATAIQITHAADLTRRIPLGAPAGSEVGRLILAFNETLERLDTLFSAQSRFLADISHELRTPLTAIRGNVDLMARMGADSESLEAIRSESDRMIRLVGDLLLLSRAEAGNLPLAHDPVEMDTLLLEVFQQALLLAQGKLSVEVGFLEQVMVSGDRDRLKQLLLNLVTNAVFYTQAGGRVLLSLRTVSDWMHLTVSDNGPGIPADMIPHIFDRFFRLEKSRGRGSLGGAGLGLSIAQYIAQGHQGRIEVASEVGKGTTFSLWLPLLHSIHPPVKNSSG
jgi:two-component system, OmpR family, sensor kinase